MPAFAADDGTELAYHVMGEGEPLLYTAVHPERVRPLTLITARARALGIGFTEEHRREAAALRSAEPWFAATRDSFEACLAGTATDAIASGG